MRPAPNADTDQPQGRIDAQADEEIDGAGRLRLTMQNLRRYAPTIFPDDRGTGVRIVWNPNSEGRIFSSVGFLACSARRKAIFLPLGMSVGARISIW